MINFVEQQESLLTTFRLFSSTFRYLLYICRKVFRHRLLMNLLHLMLNTSARDVHLIKKTI